MKLQIWDTAGQERFRTITTAYYRGAMGILLVYDVSDESSFANVRNWMRQIEQNAAENVNRVLIGNKADVEEGDRKVTYAQGNLKIPSKIFYISIYQLQFYTGKALADEFGIKFFETSAKMNTNVDEAFFSMSADIVGRLKENPEHYGSENGVNLNKQGSSAASKNCC